MKRKTITFILSVPSKSVCENAVVKVWAPNDLFRFKERLVRKGTRTVVSCVKVQRFVDPFTPTSSLHRLCGSIITSPHFLLFYQWTIVIINLAIRGLCHLNINNCHYLGFAGTTVCCRFSLEDSRSALHTKFLEDSGCHLYNPEVLFASARLKSPLTAFYYGSSDQSWEALHRTSVLANSLLILAHGPISTCVWFGTTVSVTLRLSLRGQGGAPATLLSGREHTHKECVGWREMGSERREGSVPSLQRKGERSLVDGDELQSLRERRAALALCEVAACYVAVGLLRTGRHWFLQCKSVRLENVNVLKFKRKTRNTDLSMVLKRGLHIKRQAFFPSILPSRRRQ